MRQFVAHALHDVAYVALFALVPWLEYDRQLTACLIRAYARARSSHVENILHVGILHQEGHGAVGHFARTLYSGTFGQFELWSSCGMKLWGSRRFMTHIPISTMPKAAIMRLG